jgi:hypothetical protein
MMMRGRTRSQEIGKREDGLGMNAGFKLYGHTNT